MPAADEWLATFQLDALRYPILLVIGPSYSGKTEWANSLFKSPLDLKIGSLMHFPDGLRRFDRRRHDGIILDDIRDFNFLADNQHALQGKYNAEVEFASTPGGQCAYALDLYAVPIVAAANHSTKNSQLLDDHDWLSKTSNRRIIYWKRPTGASSASVA